MVFDNLHGAPSSVLAGGRLDQGADGVDCHPVAANDLANIGRVHAQLEQREVPPIHRGDRHGLGVFHEATHDKFEKILHGIDADNQAAASAVAGAAAALFAFLMKLRTVSDG